NSVGMRRAPHLIDSVDIGVVRPEDGVERGVCVVCHVWPDPPVIVIVRLLVQAVEVGSVGVEVVGLGRGEGGNVSPGATVALGTTEYRPLQRIAHLRLKYAR